MREAVSTLVALLEKAGSPVFLPGCVPNGAPMPRVILQPELQPFPRWGWAQATAWFTGRDANEERVAWLERLRGSFGLRPCGEGWLLTGAPEDKVFGAEGDLLMVRLRFPVLVLQPVSEEIFDFADDEVEEEC